MASTIGMLNQSPQVMAPKKISTDALVALDPKSLITKKKTNKPDSDKSPGKILGQMIFEDGVALGVDDGEEE